MAFGYSDAELERMLGEVESSLCERKESFDGDAPTKGREAVCAFANDLAASGKPGVLFVGVKDDGTPSGLAIDDALLLKLADIKSDGNILPPPTMTVETRVLRGVPVAVVTIAPSDSTPVRFKGRIWIRTGPRRTVASAQDERILNEKRRFKDRPFDIQPVGGASLADMDLAWFSATYLRAAFAPDVLEANDRTVEQRLAATKMVVSAEQPTPTVLGMLVLGTRTRDFLPGAYVQFLRIAGRAMGEPVVDDLVVDGTLGDVIRRLDEKIQAHNRTAVDYAGRGQEKRSPDYSVPALQQLTRNAILHRAYEATNAPIRVTWYDDRIEILSPGGPFGLVNESNFGQPGVADYRNPNVAEALRVLGYVQKFGSGIALARAELKKNGNGPPVFAVNSSYVNVTVKAAP